MNGRRSSTFRSGTVLHSSPWQRQLQLGKRTYRTEQAVEVVQPLVGRLIRRGEIEDKPPGAVTQEFATFDMPVGICREAR